ncbi:hypothetical protein [Legionella hackeliae]|uniref:Uncharacterized protein n=1 Tax=Legionella hackeliae TaxID=449 RepID=A0A0A8UP68_LEGHA|nr:hypothetical protein [Legionella hackeliae]KTD13921.1 hypothetical protein Lhac_0765 [Legionella hackeliae]CEK10625.1 conserved protein of unknown function [Legionella hackeliae]STX47367.1 Uncharacterised protein [Legionella hackeliae]
MSVEKVEVENELSQWLSTYGLVTVERILERYKIRLQQEDLISAIKSPNTFYHQLMRVPLKNVLNGIILQQAHDYQVYAQKLFVDYLLSGESNKTEDSPGGYTRDDLEKERQALIKLGEEFHEHELTHSRLIADSQRSLIKMVEEWHKILQQVAKKIKTALQSQQIVVNENAILQSINILLIMQDFSKTSVANTQADGWKRVEKIIQQQLSSDSKQVFIEQIGTLRNFMSESETSLQDFIDKIAAMTASLRDFRTNFYNLILKTNELIRLLPEYRVDPVQTEENRESLYFDTAIGEQS